LLVASLLESTSCRLAAHAPRRWTAPERTALRFILPCGGYRAASPAGASCCSLLRFSPAFLTSRFLLHRSLSIPCGGWERDPPAGWFLREARRSCVYGFPPLDLRPKRADDGAMISPRAWATVLAVLCISGPISLGCGPCERVRNGENCVPSPVAGRAFSFDAIDRCSSGCLMNYRCRVAVTGRIVQASLLTDCSTGSCLNVCGTAVARCDVPALPAGPYTLTINGDARASFVVGSVSDAPMGCKILPN